MAKFIWRLSSDLGKGIAFNDFLECKDPASAVFSECERYRYALARVFDPLLYDPRNALLSIGLNPSTADHEVNDPTIRREIFFAQQWGFSALWKANLFAWRATDPRDMKAAHRDGHGPVGLANNGWIIGLARKARTTIVTWGNHGAFLGRSTEVLQHLRAMNIRPRCFRITAQGQPEHSLYQRNDAELIDVPGALHGT